MFQYPAHILYNLETFVSKTADPQKVFFSPHSIFCPCVCVSQYLHSRWWWRPSGCSPCQSCGGPAPCLPSGWCWRSRWWQCSAGRMGCLWRPQTHQDVSPLTARAAAPAASPAPPNVCEGKTKRNMVEERSHHKIWSFIVVYKSNQILLTIKS